MPRVDLPFAPCCLDAQAIWGRKPGGFVEALCRGGSEGARTAFSALIASASRSGRRAKIGETR
ncbi:MAG: hypothetical protein OXC63_11315 [Aestuariivita sp.]|nr:hypothetical protein [Aestuariivita sp.]MCY4347401.1 hypothetical protein [Aestuariivita sp.]